MITHERRNGSEWIGGRIKLRSVITEPGAAPFQPEAFVWLSKNGLLLGGKAFAPGDAAAQLGKLFEDTVSDPAIGYPHRPARVRVASSELADALRREIGWRTRVVCAPTPELDAIAGRFCEHLERLEAEEISASVPPTSDSEEGLAESGPWLEEAGGEETATADDPLDAPNESTTRPSSLSPEERRLKRNKRRAVRASRRKNR